MRQSSQGILLYRPNVCNKERAANRRRPFYFQYGNAPYGAVQKYTSGKSVPPYDGKNQWSFAKSGKRRFRFSE